MFRRIPLAAFIAFRIIRSRRSPALSLVTIISILGVAFGVLALTVVLGVTNGFQGAFQERILGLYPHMVVLKRGGDFRGYEELADRIRNTRGVAGASPVTYDDMMIAAGVNRSGSVIKGIHLPTVDEAVNVRRLLLDGAELESLDEDPKVSQQGDEVTVAAPVAGTWLTIVAGAGPSPTVLFDDRTPPDPGWVRVMVLDLRRGALSDKPYTLTPVIAPEDKDPSDGGLDTRKVTDFLLAPGEASRAVEVRGGPWRLGLTEDQVELEAGTIVTIALFDAPDGQGVETRIMVEASRVPVRDRAAMVRVLNLGPRAVELSGPGGGPGVVGPIDPRGGFSGYVPLDGRLPGVILGKSLAERLAAEVGTEVTLVTPLRGVDNKMMGPYGMAPSSQRHVVTGLFESGFYEYDVRLALVNLEAAQRFLNRGRVIRWIEVRADELLGLEETKRRVTATVDPYDIDTLVDTANTFEGKLSKVIEGDVRGTSLVQVDGFVTGMQNLVEVVSLLKYHEVDFGYRPSYRLIDWQEMNSNLFAALKLQKVVLGIFFLIIIVVGSFVVVGSQIMVIHEKTPDIAIMKAMGATKGVIRGIFTLQGFVVAGVGAVLGLVAGVGICALIGAIDYELEASIYLIDKLPVRLDAVELTVVVLLSLVFTLVATQVSAGRASAKNPVEGLRLVD